MRTTIEDMQKAGALESICLYHHDGGYSIDDWAETTTFAQREFREVDTRILAELINLAKAARERAVACQSAIKSKLILNGSKNPEQASQ